jgi:signal transduction histidine kinase
VATNEGVHMLDENDRVRRTINWRDGLENQNVTGMEMDKDGRLWLATSNGLYRYDIKSGNMTRYGIQDGLFSNSLENSFHQTPDGELFMGFAYAFNLGRPQSMPVNMTPPKVVLDGIKVLNKARPLPTDGRLILRPGENVVSFDFAVINFTQSDRNVLAYKLDGFDNTWTETRQNTITYTNLDGGTYTLLVRARNRDGVWSTQVFPLKIKVIPPFYQTWWFRLLFMAFVAGIAAFVAWYRQLEKRRLDAIRRRIARDLHDDMGSTLSSIRFFSEVAQNKLGDGNPETSSLLQRIAQSAADLSEAMQDIVWAINVRFDKIDDLALRMREFGIKVCEACGIAFVSDIPAVWPDWQLRPDQKRNIYLIYKETVNNAAKYAQATEISVGLRLQGRNLRLDIRDNGRGFDTAETTPGNGLINMRQRALDIRGTLEISSRAGEGTQITLLTPLS